MTIIVVEHNIEAFAPLADLVVLVNDGRLERIGPPAELLADLDFLQARDIYPPQVAQVFQRLRQHRIDAGDLPLSDETGLVRGRQLLGARP
jgi:ABC-type proline/glycine betaine transport system ATPase subunit